MSDDTDRSAPGDEPDAEGKAGTDAGDAGGGTPGDDEGAGTDAGGDAASPVTGPGPTSARVEYDDETLSRLLEALLFVSPHPVSVSRLARAVRTTYAAVRQAMKLVEGRLEGHGIRVVEVGGGWHMRTLPECGPVVQKYLDAKPMRLSKAALEALAVIAYRQPVTKPDVDEIRGVDSGSAVRLLIDRGLIRILGRKEEPGRPLLYGTTAAFLEFFGLRALTDLPTLRDVADLTDESRRQLERDLFARAPEPLLADDESWVGSPRRHWEDLVEVLGTDLGGLPEGVEVMPEDETESEATSPAGPEERAREDVEGDAYDREPGAGDDPGGEPEEPEEEEEEP